MPLFDEQVVTTFYGVDFQALIVSDSSSAEGVSSATAALMSQAPPANFCSMVVRLIALQILNTMVGIKIYLTIPTLSENTRYHLLHYLTLF